MVMSICARVSQQAEMVLSLSSDGFDAADDYAIIGACNCHESRMVRMCVYRCCGQGFPAKVESNGLC